jgi:hypothetical protein
MAIYFCELMLGLISMMGKSLMFLKVSFKVLSFYKLSL